MNLERRTYADTIQMKKYYYIHLSYIYTATVFKDKALWKYKKADKTVPG